MRRFYFPSFITLSLYLGYILRTVFVEDMEYKEDEEFNFLRSQAVGITEPWPWFGIPSGTFLVNPGMSVWVFVWIARFVQARTPLDLAHAVQQFAWLGMALILPFALWFVEKENQRSWLWALALAMVNPFLVFYQRKLWPEPIMPAFCMLIYMGWWKRHTRSGAFIWGLFGALLGQIHMSGFFFSASLFLWTLFFDRGSKKRWFFWYLGSHLGALPLIPWLWHIYLNPVEQKLVGWNEMIQLKYWLFWFSDGLGFHLGNPLGLHRGPSHFDQLSDFIRYPLFGNSPTYLVGFAHVFLLSVAGVIVIRFLKQQIERKFWTADSQTSFMIRQAFFGCGALLTATGVMIRRYYMATTFPLEFLTWIQMAKPLTQKGHILLSLLWVAELLISWQFVGYIHQNQGATQGDYGEAYHLIQKKNREIHPISN